MSELARDRAPVPGFSTRRIMAMVRRHYYLLRGSLPRILEMAYWPTVQMVIWGFVTQFFMGHSSWVANAAGILIGAVLLWDLLFRSQIGFSMCFLEEMWSRNLGHLFVSPLKPSEFVIAMMVMSLLRGIIGLLPSWVLAYVFFEFSVFSYGPGIVAFFSCLFVMGWGLGMAVIALVLRFGLGAESLAWVAIFAFAPISAVYYPVSTLPEWLQIVAWCTPSAYVFEGMRAVFIDGVFRTDLLMGAIGVNLVYLAIGAGLFAWSFASARQHGRLLQMGE
ncbi:MAG: ABC transporter permease [Alphaproteobacteria bacterium]|jgi:ABC-2 type transport system permease protein|nr:ABC transporter permease [Alphaproteobacteria bacterium]